MNVKESESSHVFIGLLKTLSKRCDWKDIYDVNLVEGTVLILFYYVFWGLFVNSGVLLVKVKSLIL